METRVSALQERVEELEARLVEEILAEDEETRASRPAKYRPADTPPGLFREENPDPSKTLAEDVRSFVETVEVAESDLSSRLERLKLELDLPWAGPETAEFAARWEKFLVDMSLVTKALADAASSLEAGRSASGKGASPGTRSADEGATRAGDAGATRGTERT